MTIYERNMEYLRENKNDLFEALQKELPKDNVRKGNYEICQSRNGSLNIKLNFNNQEFFIHSNYDPDLEAERWASGVDMGSELIVIYGLGLGYHIEKLLKQVGQNTRIIIIEPDFELFRLFIENRNLETILKDNTFLILNNDSNVIALEIFKEFKKSLLGKIDFYSYSVYKTLFYDLYDVVRNRFSDIIKVLMVNIATSEYFKKQWLANYLVNVFQVKSAINGRHLLNKFKDIPAIIVSAGPSLNKNIEVLKTAKNKALFLAGGSSFRILKKHGIDPDFAVAIDGSPKIKDIYEGLDVEGSGLIYINRTNSEVVQAYTNHRVLFIDSEDKLSSNFGQLMGIDFQVIHPDQTVAGTCVSIASLLGCNPIILVGQDFALTGLELHANGAAHMHNFKEMLKTNPKDLVKTKDIYSEDTYTMTSLLSSRTSMEDIIKIEVQLGHKFINATEGGIGVAHCENMDLKTVIEKYLNSSYNVGNIVGEIYNDQGNYINVDNTKMRDYFEDMKKESISLKDKATVLNGLCEKAKMELERKNIKFDKYSEYAQQINQLQMEIEEERFYKDMIVSTVEQSIAILKIVMEDNIKKSDDIVGKNLARIEFINKQMMEIAEVCTFLETFILNVYEPIYKEGLNMA